MAGMHTNEIFIENGRFHGQLIAKVQNPSQSLVCLVSVAIRTNVWQAYCIY